MMINKSIICNKVFLFIYQGDIKGKFKTEALFAWCASALNERNHSLQG